MASRSRDVTRADVQATILHGIRGYDGKLLANDLKCLDALEEYSVTIQDGRCRAGLSLGRNGFELIRHSSSLGDFFDHLALKTQYADEMKSFIGGLTGADKVIIIDCVIRGSPELMAEKPDNRVYEYAFKAHSDGDGETFLRMSDLADHEVTSRYRNGRYAVYTVWRPLAPVEQKPLALCDGSTVARDDLVAAYYAGYDELADKHPDLDYPPPSTYFHMAYSPKQEWYYFPDMTPQEVLVFKQWDSEPGAVLCVPHSAFEDPNSRPDAAPRTAVEARAVVFFAD